MQRNEHRSHPCGLADLLLPYALIDDGILLQQDGSLPTLDLSRPRHNVGGAGRDGRVEHALEFRVAAGERLDGPVRCDSLACAIPSKARFPIA
jgi:hypothetical protein